jgi:hypothetical protein
VLARIFASSFTSDVGGDGDGGRRLWVNDLRLAEIACPSMVCEFNFTRHRRHDAHLMRINVGK